MKNRFLILGGGIAGISAAGKIRELLPEAEITVVSGEDTFPYLRPLLSKTDFRTFQKEKILLADETWFRENRILFLKGRRVESIDAKLHLVTLEDGMKLSYDKCIYALGAECFVPPIPGRDKEGVFTLRTVEDYRGLRRRTFRAEDAVLVGGGVIGLEMAWELRGMGLSCTVLEAAPRLMERQLDPESSGILTEHIRRAGIECYTGVQVTKLTGDKEVTGVQLADGRWFPGSIVLLSTGVRPVTGPAEAAGLSCGRGVIADETLRTNDPDIYAAGDCISCPVPNPCLWKYARLSGETAAHNAACPEDPLRLISGCYPVVLSAMGTNLFSLGDVSEGEEVTAVRGETSCDDRSFFRVNGHEGDLACRQKFFYRNGKLCGAVLMGDLSGMAGILDQLGGV